MNSDQINKWLSLIANFGVIGGLVLLAMELDQNSEMLEAQARSNLSAARGSYQSNVASNAGGLADLIYKSRTEELEGAERFQVDVHWSLVINNWESMYYEVQSGPLSEGDLPVQLWATTLSGNPGLVDHYLRRKEGFDSGFVAIIDSLIEQ